MKQRNHFHFIFQIFLVGFAANFSLLASDWPNFRGPGHDGISTEKNWSAQWPAEGPKQLWKANVGIGFSSMSVADGRVFTMGNAEDKDSVFCFDAETGKQIWKHTYDCQLDPKYYEGGPSVTPTVAGKRVFTFSRKGDLFCFDAADGKVIWQKNIAKELGAEIPTWGFAGSPLVENDLLVLNVGGCGAALDKNSGKVIWSSGKEPSGYSTPLACKFGGKPAIVFFTQQHAVAIEPKTGHDIWRYPWKTKYDVNASQPIVIGDKVFISSGYDHGCALLQIKDGEKNVLWENKNMRNQLNSSVLVDGYLYGIDGDAGRGALACVELASGAVKWSEKSLGSGALVVADKKLIAISDKGELVTAEVSPTEFKQISRAQVLGGKCWTVPVLANGKIYCRNAKGDLVCLDVKGK